MSVVKLTYGVFGLKRSTEEKEDPSSEEKRPKIDLEENVTVTDAEDVTEDTDQSDEIEWLIDASLSDDPFKNHLAKKILGEKFTRD